jgi:hypothetical protein
MNKAELYHLADVIERVQEELRDEAPPDAPPCGYVNRAGDVEECGNNPPDHPDHDTAEDIRARLRATGGYTVNPFPGLPEPAGLNWHGSDYRTRGDAKA